MDLFDTFHGLARATSEADFSAVGLSMSRSDFLSKTLDGAPVFLLHDAGTVEFTPGMSLKNISVQYQVTCRVQTDTGPFEGQFALLMCDAESPELYELFVRCVGAAIEQLPVNAGTMDIETCVRDLMSLFRAMSAPGGREVAGLWAELFVISKSQNIECALQAWHADTFERFDFSWPEAVMEVKATQGATRVHEFGLDQLDVPTGGTGHVASFLLQPLTNGVGVMDLATQIDANLLGAPALRERLWSNITTALGRDFGDKLDRRFDSAFAERNLVLLDMADIPAPARPADPRVSSIRFRADLTTVPPASSTPGIRALKDLFSSY